MAYILNNIGIIADISQTYIMLISGIFHTHLSGSPNRSSQRGGGQSTGEGHESPDRKGSIVVESTTCSMIYNTSLAAPGALAHRLQCNTPCNATPPAMPHPVQCHTACKTAKANLHSPHLKTEITFFQ